MVKVLDEAGVKRFIELYMSGYTYSEIFKELGLTPSAISIYARVLNLPPRSKTSSDDVISKVIELGRAGKTRKEIAEELGISEHYVSEILSIAGIKRRKYIRCPEIPKEVIEKYVVNNTPRITIIKELNISLNCLRKLMNKYGIKYGRISRNPEELAQRTLNFFKTLGRGYTLDFRNEVRKIDKVLYNALMKMGPYTFFNLMMHNIKDLRWFRLTTISTPTYSVFTYKLYRKHIVYLKGHEEEVLKELLNMKKPGIPTYVLKYILLVNNAPKELIELLQHSCVEGGVNLPQT